MNDADFYIGKPIRSLQTMLRVIAAADGTIPQVVPDGIYGPDTEAAVTAFQARSGLPPTGEADQATWNRVVDAYLKLGSFVLPIEALRIRWQPQQSIDVIVSFAFELARRPVYSLTLLAKGKGTGINAFYRESDCKDNEF